MLEINQRVCRVVGYSGGAMGTVLYTLWHKLPAVERLLCRIHNKCRTF